LTQWVYRARSPSISSVVTLCIKHIPRYSHAPEGQGKTLALRRVRARVRKTIRDHNLLNFLVLSFDRINNRLDLYHV
jgi:hypothetical protein